MLQKVVLFRHSFVTCLKDFNVILVCSEDNIVYAIYSLADSTNLLSFTLYVYCFRIRHLLITILGITSDNLLVRPLTSAFILMRYSWHYCWASEAYYLITYRHANNVRQLVKILLWKCCQFSYSKFAYWNFAIIFNVIFIPRHSIVPKT